MTIASLTAYFLGMMLFFTPVKQHAYYEAASVTEARYADIARTLASVISAEPMSDEERLKVGSVMVSIGDAESNWNAAVVSCEKGGDGGKAWGPWQTQLPKEKVCEGTASALRLALGMVKTSFLACKHLAVPDRLSWYTDGRCVPNWKRSSWRMNRALTWVKTHPFTVFVVPFSAATIEAP